MRIVVPARHASTIGKLAPALTAATEPAPRDAPSWVDLTLPRRNTGTRIAPRPSVEEMRVTDLLTREQT